MQKNILSTQKINEAKQILSAKDTTIDSIKQSAKTLELNINEVKIVNDIEQPSIKTDSKELNIKEEYKKQNNILDKIFLDKFQVNKKIATLKNIDIQYDKKSTEISNIQTNTIKIEKEIDIIVETSVIQTITTKIIESKQKLNSFMSDVAKKMYLNYKPPVTSFKFNLTPANLGNIAITMKSNKNNNSLSVSLKMNNKNTLEVFTDNRLSLQSALTKSFDNTTTINIDLDMQQSDSNNTFEQFNQQQDKNNNSEQTNEDTNSTEIKEEQIEDQSYM